MKEFTVIGIDTAKNWIQLHAVDAHGKAVLKKRLARNQFLPFMANLQKCLIGMEACGGAHHWAAELTKLGFTVRLMDARKVKKYADNQKNDARDAAACAEAVVRPNMRFVSIKNTTQLKIQELHRIRSYYVKQQTKMMNMIRGILLEGGMAISKGKASLMNYLCLLVAEEDKRLSGELKELVKDLYEELKHVEEKVKQHTSKVENLAKEDAACQKIMTIPGVGPLTATALIAKIGNGSEFKKGRDLSAYLGLVPKQHSSGDKQCLGKITKHGDRYLRELLVHGGRAMVQSAMRIDKTNKSFVKNDRHSVWTRELCDRIGRNKAAVALANKNARIIIRVLQNKMNFEADLAHGYYEAAA